ncbi:GNAT family N-acetyltransferase [Paenibacillus sp. SC116]|uniref:GNAT family N-acetyltransferase n=1 Tax=Paenibacillus sp. SC116 TaxID=2968986 RepID=UPI00215B4DD3|nr:GNAT family N-acetyltransferase [Paenibacillus sp. SC116]MCR8845329.1 GNAT family N-acetyltransferase [Paenibacillus sp. SC116]
MRFEIADESYYPFILERDKHMCKSLMMRKLKDKEFIVAINDQNETVGWLRYGYFWDLFPFMNMLYFDDAYRNKGYGRQLVEFWEAEMRTMGHNQVMTSSQSNEEAQHFYRKLGYKDSGSLLMDIDPALEIIFTKKL